MLKKLFFTGITLALLTTSPTLNLDVASAKTKSVPQQQQKAKVKELSSKQAVELAFTLARITSKVQAGGDYKDGEYKTISLNGKTYRYLAGNIDTKKELLTYVKRALTSTAAEQWIKDMGIIEYKGKMVQLEADGGSQEQWNKAKAEFVREDKGTKYYRLSVPMQGTSEKIVYMVEYQYVQHSGWKINKKPYWDLDIPFNVNPVQVFFQHLLTNPDVAKNQFVETSNQKFPFDEFRKGIKKAELKELKEIARSATQVEYVAKVNLALEDNYQGSLNKGVNQFFFLIQPYDEMEFKIVSMGTGPHLIK